MKSLAILCLLAYGFVGLQASTTVPDNVTSVSDSENKSTTASAVNSSKTPEEMAQIIKDKVTHLIEHCKTTAKFTPEQVKLATNQAIPKTEAERCFLGCIYDGIGLSKEGVFSETGAKALAQQRFGSNPEELTKANTMIDICSKHLASAKDANEKCSIGKLLRECFVQNGPKINFLPKLV